MDYTANHHLPQWVKSDRIMMDDFNQMCRDIETGLNQAQATATSVLGTAQTTDTRLRTIAADMSRDFYRQAVQQKLHRRTAGIMDSMWLNALICREDAPGIWCGGNGVTLSSRRATMEGIRESAKEESYVCTVPGAAYKNDTAAVTFTSNGRHPGERCYYHRVALRLRQHGRGFHDFSVRGGYRQAGRSGGAL